MSQQEFAPEPQSERPENEDEIYKPQYPYSWSGNADSKAAPRDEPPSTYEYNPDAMLQGYQAQDIAAQSQQADTHYANPYEYQPSAQEQLPPPYQYDPYGNNAANTYEQGYNPYNNNAQITPGPGFNPYNNGQNSQGQGVPHWARPQPNQPRGFRFGWIILVLIFISMSSGAMRFFFWDFGHSGFIFLPIIFLLMIVASLFSRTWWGGNRRGGGRRGPRGW